MTIKFTPIYNVEITQQLESELSTITNILITTKSLQKTIQLHKKTLHENLSYQTAQNYIDQNYQQELSKDFIQILHKIIIAADAIQDSNFMITPGTINNYQKPPIYQTPSLPEDKLEQLLSWHDKTDLPPVLLAVIFHYKFVKIHPFRNANGRTARLLTRKILLNNGYNPKLCTLLELYIEENKQNYYKSLDLRKHNEVTEQYDEYNQRDITKCIVFFYNSLIRIASEHQKNA